MTIAILSDADSWLEDWIPQLAAKLTEKGHRVVCAHEAAMLERAELCFLLGCSQFVRRATRALFAHTLVVHESALPEGKGWSPLTWQILAGCSEIVVSLIEADDKIDSGVIYAQERLVFEGHELIDELREQQAAATMRLCESFVDRYPESALGATQQAGAESFFPRRTPEDSRLDMTKPLAEQFNLLRVVDNKRYPAFFEFAGQRYELEVRKAPALESPPPPSHTDKQDETPGRSDKQTIVIATPHGRYDALEKHLADRLGGCSIIRIRDRAALNAEALALLQPHWIFFPHWSWIIPEEVHSRFRCVIFHMTDLPYGRGGSPLQNLIVRGHKETRLTALKCVAGLDAGPIYAKEPLSLEGTAEEIFRRAARLMESMIVDIVTGNPAPVPQEGEVVLFRRRTPQDGDIAGLEDLSTVYDYIRMLDAEGYPQAFLQTDHMRFEFKQARLTDEGVEAVVRIRKRGHE